MSNELAEPVSTSADTQNQADETAPVVIEETQVEQERDDALDVSDIEKERKRFQRRIDKRTADYYSAKAENEQLRKEFEALRAQIQPQEETKQIPISEVRQVAEQLAREFEAQKAFTAKVNGTLNAGKKLEGFVEACNVVDSEYEFYKGGDKSKPTEFLKVVLESDAPAVLLHHLGTNPDLLEEFQGLTPTQISRRIERIEAAMKAPPKTSNAPKPLQPVRSGSRSDGPSDEDSTSEWLRKERARMKAAGRTI